MLRRSALAFLSSILLPQKETKGATLSNPVSEPKPVLTCPAIWLTAYTVTLHDVEKGQPVFHICDGEKEAVGLALEAAQAGESVLIQTGIDLTRLDESE